MDRRSLLRSAAAAGLALPLLPPELLALGRGLHAAARRSPLRTLSPAQNDVVVAFMDLLIPATETPGARAAQVNLFLDTLLTDWYAADERDAILAGLADLDARARAAGDAGFAGASPDHRTAILRALDGETTEWQVLPADTRGPEPYYHRLKWATVYGYYTSEIGAEDEQHYQIIPGRYDGCAPVHPGAAAGGR